MVKILQLIFQLFCYHDLCQSINELHLLTDTLQHRQFL